jgi:hypothetical protein
MPISAVSVSEVIHSLEAIPDLTDGEKSATGLPVTVCITSERDRHVKVADRSSPALPIR